MIFRLFLCLLFCSPLLTNAQFSDDFSDGEFTENPMWSGDVMDFEVDVAQRLHLNAPAETAISHLVTPCESIVDATWEFSVEFDFNPTSSNMAQVYLVSNNSDLESDLQGYFVRIGNTTKEVSLYRQDGLGDVEEIIDGTDDLLDMEPVNVRVKVTRSASGNWELSRDVLGGESYVIEGSVEDNTYESSLYFGVYCKYTSTRSDKFYFSNFIVSGSGFVDTVAPTLLSYEVESENEIGLVFSEAMDVSAVSDIGNYSVSDGIGNPTSITLIGGQEVLLLFADNFANAQDYNMDIDNLSDVSGNALNTNFDFTYFDISIATEHDVIINEILADPSPVVGLPEVEYVELFNNSNLTFDLSDWSLVNTTSENALSGILSSGSYVILCDEDDIAQLSSFGPTIGISSFSALANGGDSLTLVTGEGTVIDIVSYQTSWYQNSLFADGGYALERVNPFLFCSGSDNWKASEGPLGGSPGSQNTVFDDMPDLSPPNLIDVYVNSTTQVTLVFDEILLEGDVVIADFEIDNGITVVGSQLISSIEVELQLNPPLNNSIIYHVTVNDLQDCAGNFIVENNQMQFGLSEPIVPGDVVVNEILSNPRSEGVDFIELYNVSEKFLSLKNSRIAKASDGLILDYEIITSNDKILFPGDYIVVTEDRGIIKMEYPKAVEQNILEMSNLPSFNDDEGVVVLLNDNNEIIDSVYYSDDYHFDLLDDEDGVSLERLNFLGPSNVKNNWHSAAETEGFATPGYINSQYFSFEEHSSEFIIEPRIISPDNDGYQDVMALHYTLDQPGYVANVSILDDHGREVKKISQNELLGLEGAIYWDGLMEGGIKAPVGIYIVQVEFFDLTGKVERSKEVVTVAAKF